MESKPRRQTTPQEEGIELDPDAWDKFGEFVKQIAKAGPQHRASKPKGEKPTSARSVPRKRR